MTQGTIEAAYVMQHGHADPEQSQQTPHNECSQSSVFGIHWGNQWKHIYTLSCKHAQHYQAQSCKLQVHTIANDIFRIKTNVFSVARLYRQASATQVARTKPTMTSSSIQRISFNELVSGSEGVRYTNVDGVPYMSIRDIIMAVCGQNNDRAGETWRKLSDSYKNEVREFLRNHKFPGPGQKEQPVIRLQGALKLIMWLPGTMAKDFRSQACDILTRYLAGDQSLHAEVNANAQSQEPINEFARASLPESSRDTLMEQVATDVRQLVPIVKRLTDEMVVLRADRDKERHMRHQADGRYGSDVREANKNVREQAEYWKKQSEAHEKNSHAMAVFWDNRMESEARRSAEKDNMILECHRMLVGRMRSRSPDSERRP